MTDVINTKADNGSKVMARNFIHDIIDKDLARAAGIMG